VKAPALGDERNLATVGSGKTKIVQDLLISVDWALSAEALPDFAEVVLAGLSFFC
jgi:hypothetical protein